MKLFRNREVSRTFLAALLTAVIGTLAAFFFGIRFGVFTLVLCLVMLTVYLAGMKKRYRQIAALAADIDRILHGEKQSLPEEYAEGELGILQSEINKMTVRLQEQQQRLEEDKAFLANSLADISHQIRTPLTSIHLLASMLSDDLPAERRQALSLELYRLLSRIEWLIDTLLKISKLDAGTVSFVSQQIPLRELLQKVVEPLLIPAELREQELAITAEGDFCGDIAWSCEALTNIVKNCMEHTPDHGKIKIAASENPLYAEIVICDNGSGIAPEDLPHIFERFYKGKSAGESGFGIGLALARMIITGQNGTVQAENLPPHGAKFTVRFYKGVV